MSSESNPVRIGVVLSAGGLRGVAHLGVLRSLVRHRIPVEIIVGVSAGAIVAAYYAAVGLSVDEMIDQAPAFRGRHILMHGVTLRSPASLKPILRRFCGIIPVRLEQLEAATFTTLHHGVRRIGIVCHDIDRNHTRYFSTTDSRGVRLSDVARASAAVPRVLPAKTMIIEGDVVRLVDGGISDSLPVDFARSPRMGATHGHRVRLPLFRSGAAIRRPVVDLHQTKPGGPPAAAWSAHGDDGRRPARRSRRHRRRRCAHP